MKRNLLLITVVFLSFSYGRTQDSCGITWGNIIQISDDSLYSDSVYSYVPQVLAVGDSVHLLWFGGFTLSGGTADSSAGIQYSRSIDGGSTFSFQRQLVTYDSARGNAGYLVASGSYLYLMYIARVDSPVYSNLGILRSTDAGLTWEPRRLLGDVSPLAITARDSKVYIYFFYVEGNFARSGFFMSHDYGATWDSIHVPTLRATSFARLVATTTALNMTRQLGGTSAQEVVYNKSPDFGYTWTANETLSVVDAWQSQLTRLSTDDRGNLYAVWNDGKYGGGFSGTIVMRRSTDDGLTWLPEQMISQLATAVFCDVAVEASTVTVAWDTEVTNYTGKIQVRSSPDRGVTWCNPVELMSLSRQTGDPTISIANQRIHVTWENDTSGTSEIFYVRGHLTITSIPESEIGPENFALHQNFPNPFNPTTTIRFNLPHTVFVILKVFNLLGQEIATLVNETKTTGAYDVSWHPTYLPSGIYFYRLQAGGFIETKKLILLR